MKPIKLYLLIPILLILPSCNNQPANTARAKLTDSIPEGAVPFEYDFKYKKCILIPGTLNDSIPFKYWLETGMRSMVFSDSLASDFERKEFTKQHSKVQKTMKVRIGAWKLTYGDSVDAYYLEKNHPIFGFIGVGVGMLPWQFFDKKILEISFSKQYIRELYNTKELQGYDSVKIKVENGFLGIPVVVSVQGKKIKEFVMIDTGSNGGISFSNSIVSKYGIKSDGAYFGQSQTPVGLRKKFSFKSDTFQTGKIFLTKKYNVSFSRDKLWPFPFSGLLGTGILEHFDIVLDLKNYCLYLKPIDK